MSLPRYSEYKDSGVEWLGEVPAHWHVKPIRALATLNDEVLAESTPEDYEIEYVDIGSVNLLGGIERSESLTFGAAPSRARRVARNGDVLVSTVRTYLKAIAPVQSAPPNLVASTGFAVIRPKAGLCSTFLKYGLQCESFVQQVIARSTGVSYPAINSSDLARIPLWSPPPDEQRAIGIFLHRETARIDALIAEQEKLLALLVEKRQAIISHAVTRGLDPSVPMKDSGIPWLGEVPEHWEVAPLKWMVDPSRPIMYGIVLPGPDVGEGIPILKGGNVKPSRMNLDSMARTTAEIEAPYARARLKAGDLVYAIRGTIGDCESVPDEMEGANITQDVARVAVAETEVPSWIRWALLSAPVREELAVGSLGAAVRGVNIFDLKRVKVPRPPVEEQREIAAYLDSRTAGFDELSETAARGIGLLKERRSALISAAVTGQIDVRGVVDGEAA